VYSRSPPAGSFPHFSVNRKDITSAGDYRSLKRSQGHWSSDHIVGQVGPRAVDVHMIRGLFWPSNFGKRYPIIIMPEALGVQCVHADLEVPDYTGILG
jgi:hypothetical protein